jgi:uncharacterized membrane protein
MRRLFGPFFVFAGLMHFLRTEWYEAIVPPSLPSPRGLVYASGLAEIAGGLGAMHARTRMAAALWSIATLVAVFPANVYMAIESECFESRVPGGRVALWLRLPFQGVFVAWAWAARRS